MAKKLYIALVDSETTVTDKVADISILIVDRKGEIYNQCSVLVRGIYDSEEESLFHMRDAEGIFNPSRLVERYNNYNEMLETGQRMLASVNAINNWIAKAVIKYNPILTAYNVEFDIVKCKNTGIDIDLFQSKFCLWSATAKYICQSRKYKQFCLDNHYFTNRTDIGNMTIRTNAETVHRFLSGNINISEPHTSLEDLLYWELPTLKYILKRHSVKDISQHIAKPAWQGFQVNNHYKVK